MYDQLNMHTHVHMHTHMHTHTHTPISPHTHNTGTACASEADPCNGSTCYDLQAGGHQCICSEGWWGVGCNYSIHAESPMDRCFHYPNLCHGHGQCIWNQSFYTYFSGCKCDPGYAQTNNCEQTVDGEDYCPSESNGYCSPGSTCNNVFGNVPKKNSDTGEYKYKVVGYFCKCDGSELYHGQYYVHV